MQALLRVLYKYRASFIFVLLELLCFYLIVQNNNYQSAAFFNSANSMVGGLLETEANITDYLDLKDANRELAEENARLRMELDYQEKVEGDTTESLFRRTNLVGDYLYLPAKVINNSTRRFNNYLTIDKGSKDGIEPGMGVISPEGIVGRVKAVSENYSSVLSLLHVDLLVSSEIRRTGTKGTTVWPGKNPKEASLRYIDRHYRVLVGDTVVTSGFNAVYPEGVLIGIIDQIDLAEDATYYDIDMELTTDFNSLSFVYVVDNKMKEERDSIENVAIEQ